MTKAVERKYTTYEIKEIGDAGGNPVWEIAGYASTFGGDPDSYGDVVAPNAFAASIATRQTKLLYQHDIPIGYQIELREDDYGLYGRWAIIDTTDGTDAYKLAKAGVLDRLSIGYVPVDAEYRADGVRVLKQVDLMEVSLVTFPANESAIVTSVKARPFADHTEAIRVGLRGWLDRVVSGSDLRARDGRQMSADRIKALADVSAEIKAIAQQLDTMITPPTPRVLAGVDVRRRRLRLAGMLES